MKTQAIHMKLISDQQRKRLQKDRGTPPASIFEDIELLTTQKYCYCSSHCVGASNFIDMTKCSATESLQPIYWDMRVNATSCLV